MKTFTLENFEDAYDRLKEVVVTTPLQKNTALSERFQAEVYLKREDLQVVRSYKVRGAYNHISQLSEEKRKNGVVCASAGNHAQGVAFSCYMLHLKGFIFMPKNTPRQKVERVVALGKNWVELTLVGDTFDEAYTQAQAFALQHNRAFVPPFDDYEVVIGQGTVGVEVVAQLTPDIVFVPIGGGGLAAGIGSYIKQKNPTTEIIGVEPSGAASMKASFDAQVVTTLEKINTFVDGAAVKKVGDLNFAICKDVVDKIVVVPEGLVCKEMISLYQQDGIVTEPAGALSVAGLEVCKGEIKGKTVVCVISGGNNDVSRYLEILERSLVYQGLKHYFLIEFSQRPGALKSYINDVLGKNIDITLFEYMKKNNRETGPALVGIEIPHKKEFVALLTRMNKAKLVYQLVTPESPLYRFII